MSYTYIASPYSHPDASVRAQRYEQVLAFCAELLRAEIPVYSPIVHCHQVALDHSLPTDAQFWLSYNFAMLRPARFLYVYCIPGWNKSIGVTAEISFWRSLTGQAPIYIDPKTNKPTLDKTVVALPPPMPGGSK
jgi:hypothetical protein